MLARQINPKINPRPRVWTALGQHPANARHGTRPELRLPHHWRCITHPPCCASPQPRSSSTMERVLGHVHPKKLGLSSSAKLETPRKAAGHMARMNRLGTMKPSLSLCATSCAGLLLAGSHFCSGQPLFAVDAGWRRLRIGIKPAQERRTSSGNKFDCPHHCPFGQMLDSLTEKMAAKMRQSSLRQVPRYFSSNRAVGNVISMYFQSRSCQACQPATKASERLERKEAATRAKANVHTCTQSWI